MCKYEQENVSFKVCRRCRGESGKVYVELWLQMEKREEIQKRGFCSGAIKRH